MSTVHRIQLTKRLEAELPDRRFEQHDPLLQRVDSACVQAQLEVLFVNPIVDRGDIAG
jgi:hypothetical protein